MNLVLIPDSFDILLQLKCLMESGTHETQETCEVALVDCSAGKHQALQRKFRARNFCFAFVPPLLARIETLRASRSYYSISFQVVSTERPEIIGANKIAKNGFLKPFIILRQERQEAKKHSGCIKIFDITLRR